MRSFHIQNYQLVMPHGYQPKQWEIIAKAPANSRIQDFPLMLRSLLADRFHFAFHRETREMSVYELVVAKGGSKLKEVPPPGGGLGGDPAAPGMTNWSGKTTLATLVNVLTTELRMPVIDKTGLQGIFDINLDFAPLVASSPSEGVAASLPGPTIFDAMEKTLGLNLLPQKAPIEILVVDRLDSTPTEN